MHDPWQDILSEYIDGGLSPDEVRALEAHLTTCDACATTLTELRDVVARARALEASGPETDLWPAIAAAIRAEDADAEDASGGGAVVLPLRATGADVRARGQRVSFARARFSLSVPQLAAAAVVLMALGAGAVWLIQPAAAPSAPQVAGAETSEGVIVLNAGAVPEHARFVATPSAPTTPHASDIARLEAALDAARQRLDPATVEIVERSLEAIDQAIADAESALDADPGNPHLHRQLENTMQKKLDVLRRASGARRGGS